MPDNQDVYLLVADETPEFQIALHYTCGLAKRNNAKISVLYVMEKEDMQILGNVQKLIHEEHVSEAEKILNETSSFIEAKIGITPKTHLEEGGRYDAIEDVINNNLDIKLLILGGGTESNAPGPLVSYFTHKGLEKLRVPLVIVPENINLEDA